MATEKIWINLLDEGVPAWRSAEAEVLGGGRYRVLRPDDYDPEDEAWEFVPGTTVHCAMRRSSDGEYMVASKRCGPAPGDQGHLNCAVCEWTILDLPDPWWVFDPVAHEWFIEARAAELRREVDPRHGLRADGATAVAGCEDCDEVLYRLTDGRFVQVHLTWGYRPEEPPYPLTQIQDDRSTAEAAARRHGCCLPGSESPARPTSDVPAGWPWIAGSARWSSPWCRQPRRRDGAIGWAQQHPSHPATMAGATRPPRGQR